MKQLGNLIAKTREERRLSQHRLAERIKLIDPLVNISQSTLSAIENGQTYPSPKQQAAIGIALESLDIIWHYYENDEMRKAADLLLERHGINRDMGVIEAAIERINQRLISLRELASDQPLPGTREYYLWLIQIRDHAEWIKISSQSLWLYFGKKK